MNSNQVEIVLQYLRIETNYAVIINGPYGIGKTHFYKNVLSPRIKDVSLPSDEQKKYTPIHISLFGLKSVEEIQAQIFLELFPILKKKGLKLAASLGKSILRGLAQIKLGGDFDIDKYIGDFKQETKDWLNFEELVICIDDLDRKSEALSLKEVFGFINSIVENDTAKILIIANEEQLLKDSNYSFDLREKVIGVSVQYQVNTSTAYHEIIGSRYSNADRLYHEFLINNQKTILSVIEANSNNFRNFIFFLEHFKPIFYAVEKLFQEDRDFSILKEKKLASILDFTLSIAMEYKLGKLNSTNLDKIKKVGLDAQFTPLQTVSLNQKNKEKQDENKTEPDYTATFENKYFSGKSYYYFRSIIEYITGINAFEINTLKKELENYFIVKDGVVPFHEEILQRLEYYDCLNLSYKEYRKLTLQMLSSVDKGEYQLYQYTKVFHFATRFNNILKFDFVNLKKRIFRGIKKGIPSYAYIFDLDFKLSVSNDIEFRDEILKIIKYCVEVNELIRVKNEHNKLNELFWLFNNDIKAFLDKVQLRDNEFSFIPMWNRFNFKEFMTTLKNIDNTEIWRLSCKLPQK